jgi:hypothetical protein
MSRDPLEGIAEAARWRLLGLLLERPREGWGEEVTLLAAEVGEAAIAAAAEAVRAEDEGAYLAALGPGAPVSPREVAWRGLADPGWLLADVQRFYDAFAYRPRTEDPIDHVAVETGFVAYLLLKEEAARAAGDEARARAAADGRQAFVVGHLAPMAVPLAEALAAQGSPGVAAAAALLAARLPAGTPREDPPTAALPCERCAGTWEPEG